MFSKSLTVASVVWCITYSIEVPAYVLIHDLGTDLWDNFIIPDILSCQMLGLETRAPHIAILQLVASRFPYTYAYYFNHF